jgi:UDP-3-O-[3-hydroxymyristoyl] glucosamine N-acyltransferase
MGRKIITRLSVLELASHLGASYTGSSVDICGASSLDEASANDLCFLKSFNYLNHVKPLTIVITTNELAPLVVDAGAFAIISTNPRLDFAIGLSFLEDNSGFIWSKNEPIIHPTSKIGSNVVLGNGVKIGAHSEILNNVVIGNEVIIGERCIIKSCAVIGEDGFGFERAENGHAIRLPHIGSVLIGDDVEIGSLTTVCRGTLNNTKICDGVKIDDHVHIAHNVIVGNHSFVIACAEISGGVTIGKNSWIAPCAAVKNQVSIGDNTVIGIGAVVLKDVGNGQVIVGNPGKVLSR